MAAHTSKSHAKFQKALKDSYPSVWFAAMHLWKDRGFDVCLQPPAVAPNHYQKKEYSDGGDIWIRGKDREWKLTEIKQLSIKNRAHAFTTLATWPYSDFIMDGEYSFDNKKTVPYQYLVVNEPMTAYAVVQVEASRLYWVIKSMPDPATGEDKPYYVLPDIKGEHKDKVRFYSVQKLSEWSS